MGVVYKEGLVPGVYKRDQPKKWYRAALELSHQCDKIIKLSPLTGSYILSFIYSLGFRRTCPTV